MTEHYDLGVALRVEVEALGVPGQRTFRMRAMGPSHWATLWLEKEQLQMLAVGIAQLLHGLGEGGKVAEATTPERSPSFPSSPGIEFHVGRMGLGFDEERGLCALYVFEQEVPEEEEEPTLRLLASARQLATLTEQLLEVIAAGRPRCQLCGFPMNPGEKHVCPRLNGHRPDENKAAF